jgi:hypothetical protein
MSIPDTPHARRLVFSDFVQHPVFLDVLGARPGVEVTRLAFAGDVAADFEALRRAPPPKDHPLPALDTVIATPHTAGATEDSRARVARFAAGQLLGIFAGERRPRLVNPEVWPRYLERRAAVLANRD